MAAGRRQFGTGLLSKRKGYERMTLRNTVLLLFLTPVLYAQEYGKPRYLIQTSPDLPVEGSALTLTLLTDHDNPDEVNVLAPPFTDGLILEYMLKGPRTVNADTDRWTAMEFRFTLTGHGTFTFGSFTVFTPRGRIQTEPFDIVVQKQPAGTAGAAGAGTGETARFRLSWENVPANLKIGENAVISLRVNDRTKAVTLPDAGLFVPPVPPGHIIESIPVSENEKSSGIALKLRVIPLQTGVLTIDNRRLTIENTIYEVPVLKIQVVRATGTVRR